MGIFATLENADTGLEAGDEVSFVEDQLVAANDAAETEAATGEIAADAHEVDEAIAITGELNTLGDIAEESIESGEGMSEDQAEAVLVSMESAMFRLGMRQSDIASKLPSCESFGNAQTRMSVSIATLETISETVKRVWVYVKTIAARIYESFMALIGKLFNSAKTLEKSFKSLRDRASEMSSKNGTAEKAKFDTALASLVSQSEEAGYKDIQSILENSSKLADCSASVVDEVGRALALMAARAGRAATFKIETSDKSASITTATGVKIVVSGHTAAVMKEIEKELSPLGAAEKKVESSGLPTVPANNASVNWNTVTVHGPFAGMKVLVTGQIADLSSKKEVSSAEAIDNYGIRFEKMKGVKGKTLVTLSLDEIIKTCDAGSNLCKQFAKLEKLRSESAGVRKESENLANAAIKAAEKAQATDGDKGTKALLNAFRGAVGVTQKMSQVMTGQAPAVVYQGANLAYRVAAASLAQYKAGK